MSLLRAVLSRAARGGADDTFFHATPQKWRRAHPLARLQPDIDQGEGFGFHYGSRRAADARLHSNPGEAERTYSVRQRPAQREIELPDLGGWEPRFMSVALRHDRPRLMERSGLSKTELDQLEELIAGLPAEQRSEPQVLRAALRNLGVDRIRYRNSHEDAGSTSYIDLEPRNVRLSDPEYRRRVALGVAGSSAAGAGAIGGGGLIAQLRQRERER
jgi:hypothetical protein